MKKIKNFILMLLTFTIIFVSIPVSSVNASNDYLTSFTVSKKVIYKGNGVSISVDKAKKGSRNVEITFVVKNNTIAVKIPSIHPGTLAVNSFTALKTANDKFSNQKYNGGFSKKYSPLRNKVI